VRDLKSRLVREPAYIAPTGPAGGTIAHALEENLAQLTTQQAELLTRYKPGTLELQRIEAQIGGVRERLAVEARKPVPNPAVTALRQKLEDRQSALRMMEVEYRAIHALLGAGAQRSFRRARSRNVQRTR
jgi:hypothetical protein